MPASIEIQFGGESLQLLPDRALLWSRYNALILADVHLGKDASFRAAGLPVPAGNSVKDLMRIQSLLASTGATRLIVLGDLVHNRSSHQAELSAAFEAWRGAHPELDVLLIRGNHDRHAGPTPDAWRVNQVSEPFDAGELVLAHKPQSADKPLLCGHVHPTVSVRDFDRTCATLLCFVIEGNQLIVPAFGSFTGGYNMRNEPGRKIYAIAGKSVVRVEASRESSDRH